MLFATAEAVLAQFPLQVRGCANASLACVSSGPLPAEARDAVAASAERLGYGRENVAWIETTPAAEEEEAPAAGVAGDAVGEGPAAAPAQASGEGAAVSEKEPAAIATAEADAADAAPLTELRLRTVVEGLDPVALVVADAAAAALLAEAYRQPVFCDHPNRLSARSVAAFTNFAALLEIPEGKQRAWSLLKELTLE